MKKILCFVLTACLGVVLVIPSYAGSEEGKELEQAILSVKAVVDVPDNYTDFTHYSYDQETDWDKGTVWSLNWADKDSNSIISAVVDWKGNLLSFENYKKIDEKGLARFNREQASISAEAFIKKALPELAANFRETDIDNSRQDNYRHAFHYKYFKNGIPLNFAYITVWVNKYSGEVESFSGLSGGFSLPDLPEPIGLIGADKAMSNFLGKIGMRMIYKSNYSYKDNELSIFPAYIIKEGNKAIDAGTGEAVDIYWGKYGIYRESLNYKASADGAGGMGESETQNLSKEEIEAIEKLGGLLSKQEAVRKFIDQIPLKISSENIKNASLRKDLIDQDKYVWELSSDEIYGSVNGCTGELLNYSNYAGDSDGKRDLTEKDAKKIAETFLMKTVPSRFSESVFTTGDNNYVVSSKDDKPEAFTFNYNRVVNGVEFVDNGLRVTVNRKSGNITHYNNSWYEKVSFPSLEKAKTDEQIMEEITKKYSFDISYEFIGDKLKTGLVYGFEDEIRTAYFDPFTGMRMDSGGKAYEEIQIPQYSDIKEHWSRKIVEELTANGYYLKTDLFKPDDAITQLGFFQYLFTPEMKYYDEEALYRILENRDIIKEGEKAPDSKLTRQDAAKFLIRYLGLGLAGEHPEIFINKFKDGVTDQYKGYAMLSYGLGIMRGDDKGNFNGAKTMTNAEAAVVIINALKTK